VSKESDLKTLPNFVSIFLAKTFQIFKTLEGLSTRTKLKSARFSQPGLLTQQLSGLKKRANKREKVKYF
jgi:hypothetical protein